MFVVKKPFRNLGKVYTAGSVIAEPASIKRFKGKLAEGKIIEVTEQTYNSVAKYFKDKHGIIISALAKPEIEEPKMVEEPKKVEPTVAKVNATVISK